MAASTCITPHGLCGPSIMMKTPEQLSTGDTPRMLMNSVNRLQQLISNFVITLSVSILTVIFPNESRLASVIWVKDNGSGGDNWGYKTCKSAVKSSPPTNQYPTFYRPGALTVARPTVSKHWKEIWHHYNWVCITTMLLPYWLFVIPTHFSRSVLVRCGFPKGNLWGL